VGNTGWMSEQRTPNRLINETSPYLLQHAYNPVDWHPWGPEALELAKATDRPILLSVGYAACHWCHVMEKESFEDPATAEVMNRDFVPVKVDREERPDIDGIYMDAVQAMTGQGGWPMTVFLTPDGAPFYAGTYFPDTDRHGMPSFRRVLDAVASAWRDRHHDLVAQGRQVVTHIQRSTRLAAPEEPLDPARQAGILRVAFDTLQQAFDPEWGGFGRAPKFPQPMTLEFVLRCHARGWDGALEMVTRTLDRMLTGGIYDQLGGGFHRYATDGRWLVPHFEKMLYDNAQLVRLYTHAWQVTGAGRYRRVVAETVAYLLRELRHGQGGFFSSQDADSEGVEGRFFVWSHEELVRLAGPAVAAWYGAVPEGNWEGSNILWTPRDPATVAAEAGIGAEELSEQVEAGRRRLFEAREARVHPGTDDKVLAAWNGLAVTALAEAGRVFGQPDWVRAAVRAAEFVLGSMRAEAGRLHRAWRDGRLGGPGYLDDYALMADACLTLYETTFELRWLAEARLLADELRRLFADPEQGGFFQTGADAEQLVVRPKELFDNAVPAGNSVAADVLQRLARLAGDSSDEAAALGALRPLAELMERAPTGFGHALGALETYEAGLREVAVLGDPGAADTRALVDQVWSAYLPNKVLAVAAPGDQAAAERVPLLRDRPLLDGRATAYVCEHFVCQRPVTDPDALAGQLGAGPVPQP
jgi:uncharacterized protein YyaL (SSP411 family)